MPWGFLGMVVAVACVEKAVVRHEVDLATIDSATWGYTGWASRHKAPARPVLAFGDSHLKHGFAPAAFERASGLAVENLALGGGPAWVSYFLLKRTLEAGARPRALVVDFNTSLLFNPVHAYTPIWPHIAEPGDVAELGLATADASLAGWSLAASTLPSLRFRGEIREAIMARLGGRTGSRRDQVVDTWRRLGAEGGALLLQPSGRDGMPDPFGRDELTPLEMANHLPTQGDWQPLNLIYVQKFLRLASSRRIPVFLVLAPINPSLQARRELSGHDARAGWLTGKLRREFPEVTVLDGRAAGYPHHAFVDGEHLDRRGAASVSASIGEVVRATLDGRGDPSRWVLLAGYRPVPGDVAARPSPRR